MKNNIINAAFQMMIKATKDLVFVKDENLVYVAASMPFVKITGNENMDDVIGKKDEEIFEDKQLAKKYVADDKKLLKNQDDLIDYIEPLPNEENMPRYGSTSKYVLKDNKGNNIGILGITRDITRDYIARQRYQTELKYLFELPKDTFAVSYIDVNKWRIITQRRQSIDGATLQSCLSVEELCDAAVESILDKDSEASRFYRDFSPKSLEQIYSSGRNSLSFEYQRKLTDGTVCWVQNEINFLTDVDSGHLCVMLSAKDIDSLKQEEQMLIEAAKFDGMTMLYNRETTMKYIKEILEEYPDRRHALFMMDVDNFKNLNDTMGHQKGDEFLIMLAKEIHSVFDEKDVVGRIGGDEFFAFVKDASHNDGIEDKAKHLIATIRKVCDKYPIEELSGSIGISVSPNDGSTLDELYAKADTSLYQAKRRGKNQYVFSK